MTDDRNPARGRGRRAGTLAAFALVAGLGVAACGPPGDAPRLTNLRCAVADACQTLADPFKVRLAVDFEDPDGDLGYGVWSAWVDDASTVDAALLEPVFQATETDPAASSGVLWFEVPLQLPRLHDGLEFTVALQVNDSAGHGSNRPGLTFALGLQ